MLQYDHKKIEKKWQSNWEKKKIYKTPNTSKKKKHYVLDMFPYPSGSGLHVGHPRGYIGSDVYARMKRMQGFNVLHPMGFDSFGLPAEQYAIQTGKHPSGITNQSIKRYKEQLAVIGFSYDWDREVQTSDPAYYKWTQWIFLQIYNSWYDKKKNKARSIQELETLFVKNGNKNIDAVCDEHTTFFSAQEWKAYSDKEKQNILMKYRLAYEGYAEVNWCPDLGTVLANDEIIIRADGTMVSERGEKPVFKKNMRQWFMRITAYADRLLQGLLTVEWSEHIKDIQRNWIGKSIGSELEFSVADTLEKIKVFTTRADTFFGVTYLVLAPEHPFIQKVKTKIKNSAEVEGYIQKVKNKTSEERIENKEKTGISLEGVNAIHPLTHEQIPIWIADYVLMNYGTGAVMAVPAHDERDFEFAEKYTLPVKQVITPSYGEKQENETYVKGVCAVIFDPQTEKFAMLKWNHGLYGLVAGGLDGNEDIEQAIRREMLEESGLYDIKSIQNLCFANAHFFNTAKQTHRNADTDCFLVVLNSRLTKPVATEAHENFELIWLTPNEILENWNIKNTNHGLDHWIDFIHQGLYSLKKMGYAVSLLRDKEPVYTVFGPLINSGTFNGIEGEEAKKKITKAVGGKFVTKYKMRDAIFARQRYWGEPIPLVTDTDGLIHELSKSKLPLELPNVKTYQPSGTGESPLATVSTWVKHGYETNTMPGWAGSSWYFLRYMDNKNKKVFADKKAIKYWKNVDMYVGGAEHATGHLLYSRFWHKVLKDHGFVTEEEPFRVLKNQGMILGSDNRKMSKRWGNVVNPDDVVTQFGADTLRVFEMFLGPFESSLPWSTDGIVGSRRFIERIWRIKEYVTKTSKTSKSLEGQLHKTIQKVTHDIETFNFNTAVSSMMILVNEIEKEKSIALKDFKIFLQILAPFAPHVTDELWSQYTTQSIHLSLWPKANKKKIVVEKMTIIVQVNGKVRGQLQCEKEVERATIETNAKNIVAKYLSTDPKRIIYVPGKLINFVV